MENGSSNSKSPSPTDEENQTQKPSIRSSGRYASQTGYVARNKSGRPSKDKGGLRPDVESGKCLGMPSSQDNNSQQREPRRSDSSSSKGGVPRLAKMQKLPTLKTSSKHAPSLGRQKGLKGAASMIDGPIEFSKDQLKAGAKDKRTSGFLPYHMPGYTPHPSVTDYKYDQTHRIWCSEVQRRERDAKVKQQRQNHKAESRVNHTIARIHQMEERRNAREKENENARKQAEMAHKEKMEELLQTVNKRINMKSKNLHSRFKTVGDTIKMFRTSGHLGSSAAGEAAEEEAGEYDGLVLGDEPRKSKKSVHLPKLEEQTIKPRVSGFLSPNVNDDDEDIACMTRWMQPPVLPPLQKKKTNTYTVWVKPGQFREFLVEKTHQNYCSDDEEDSSPMKSILNALGKSVAVS